MKQIFLDYTKKYRRGGGAKKTMHSRCECCFESQTDRTKKVGGTGSTIIMSLCYKCATLDDKEIWIKMTRGLMNRILTGDRGTT